MNQPTFRRRMADLPPLPEGGGRWTERRRALRKQAQKEPLDILLQWSTITATMFSGACAQTEAYLEALKDDEDWERIKEGIKEHAFGKPERMPEDAWTSGNLARQAYCLRLWEKWTGRVVEDLERIVEFGSGYGAFCALASNLGFRGEWVSYDFPEFLLIQQVYLEGIGVKCETTFCETGTLPDLWEPADLLVSICALSETTTPERDVFLARANAASYLLVFQPRWDDVSNDRYFLDFAKEGRWRIFEGRPLGGHKALVGGFDFGI